MPSRLKLGVRADLRAFGDLSAFTPLVLAISWGEGISTVKSLFVMGNRTTLALAAAVMVAVDECGESPVEDGDMLLLCDTGLKRC